MTRTLGAVWALVLFAVNSHGAEYFSGVDLVQFARNFADKAYLQPLGLRDATLRIETENFRPGHEPLCADVHVFPHSNPRRDGTISVCVAAGRIWFAAADKDFVEFYSQKPLAEATVKARTKVLIGYLADLSGASSSAPSKRMVPGYLVYDFRVPASDFVDMGIASAAINRRSGLLGVFGTPFPSDAR